MNEWTRYWSDANTQIEEIRNQRSKMGQSVSHGKKQETAFNNWIGKARREILMLMLVSLSVPDTKQLWNALFGAIAVCLFLCYAPEQRRRLSKRHCPKSWFRRTEINLLDTKTQTSNQLLHGRPGWAKRLNFPQLTTMTPTSCRTNVETAGNAHFVVIVFAMDLPQTKTFV